MTIENIDNNLTITDVLLWQYDNAENVKAIVQKQQDWLDTNFKDFFDNWYDDVFNLQTANDFGLSVWAIILGVKFSNPIDLPTVWFGFTGSGAVAFNQAGFYPQTSATLTTEQKRIILKLRWLCLTTNATLDKICEAVNAVIPGMFLLDKLDMSLLITYPTIPNSQLQFILDNYGDVIIPRPAGVKLDTRFGYRTWFGFTGSGGTNFNNGNFGG